MKIDTDFSRMENAFPVSSSVVRSREWSASSETIISNASENHEHKKKSRFFYFLLNWSEAKHLDSCSSNLQNILSSRKFHSFSNMG